MIKRLQFHSLKLILLSALSALSGCNDGGGAPVYTPAAVPPQVYVHYGTQGFCPPGTESFGYGCKPLSAFEAGCLEHGGTLHDLQAVRICRFGIPVLENLPIPQVNGTFPRLVQAEPTAEAYDTGVEVMPGDYIYLNAQGGWGNTLASTAYTSSSYSGAYHFGAHPCGEVTVEGFDILAGHEITNPLNGLVSGLFATQGVEMIELNSNGVPHRVNARGRLELGFNSPFESGNCTNLWVRSLWIARCQDSLGTTLPCW